MHTRKTISQYYIVEIELKNNTSEDNWSNGIVKGTKHLKINPQMNTMTKRTNFQKPHTEVKTV